MKMIVIGILSKEKCLSLVGNMAFAFKTGVQGSMQRLSFHEARPLPQSGWKYAHNG
jgi:hypothetical protein